MEKRTPNDADDVLAIIISIIAACALGKHETVLAFVAQAKPCNMCMVHGFWARFAMFPALLWLLRMFNARNVAAIGSRLAKKCNRGLERGQPAQRTMSKVIFDGFVGVFNLSWSQSSPNAVPIVLMMFLYEAHARAPYRSIISTIGNPFWLNWDQEGSNVYIGPK